MPGPPRRNFFLGVVPDARGPSSAHPPAEAMPAAGLGGAGIMSRLRSAGSAGMPLSSTSTLLLVTSCWARRS
ncbi:hypothetical protein TSOC_005362 [Tetrabaena socialis]|uniref:Uncharacterized protein n=1 Tax=Tetrabaena socialis TaxID=47790 RepID=A0A2J8A6J7_9CHLO|nr:hypothetical protein TSOC_005362 [Tetrabaena socialis]|eukprot:PNH08130.1 hypothetical protein TSOC_005362 [Tetrabaena socialis]